MNNTARARIRLGIGATVPSGDNLFAQRRFMEAIQRRAPEVFHDLGTLAQQPPEGQRRVGGWLDACTESKLAAWAERWGIPYPTGWYARNARMHVNLWREEPELAHWVGSWMGGSGGTREPVWPPLARWNAHEETEEAFDARIQRYKRQVKSLPGITSTATTFAEVDFDALVLQHVTGLTFQQIATKLDQTDKADAIRKRNAQLAKLLGITLRRRPRGRPAEKTGKKKSS